MKNLQTLKINPLFIAFFVALAPFTNQSLSYFFHINSYFLSISLLMLAFIGIINKQISIRKPFLTRIFLILIIFSIYIVTSNSNLEEAIFYLLLFINFTLFYSIITIYNTKKYEHNNNHLQKISIIPIILFTCFILLMEKDGIILNIKNSSRMAIDGSVLGLSMVLASAAFICFYKYRIIKNKYLIVIFITLIILNILFFKTKGPLLALFVTILLIDNLKLKEYFLLSTVIIFAFYFLTYVRTSGLESIAIRLVLYANTIQNILSDGFVFNLFKKPDLLFHNWIFEMYWRINIFVFPFIICCMWTFINLRKFSINAYLMGIVLISGLFSFELDVVVYSALTFMMAAIIDRQNQYILEVSKVD
jgi:hypothetical protein